MQYFPVFLDVKDRVILIVGGGEAALQKARLATKSVAMIRVVSPSPHPELETMAANGIVELRRRLFKRTDLDDAALVFVSTGDDAADAATAALARELGIPVNVVDRPDRCTFITPAIIDRDPVVVAIGTEGTAPVLAQGLKSRLDALLPPGLGALARKAQELRPLVARHLPAGTARRAFWANVFFGALRDTFVSGSESAFDAAVDTVLEDRASSSSPTGRVALVGAGPGNPELMTLRAQRLLQSADVIVYDRLIGPAILDYARRDAERICVGKTPGLVSPSQDDINKTLVELARRGLNVVRLKGGDPYIFGRGAEEQAALETAGVSTEIVPGITAAAGCAASIRLPLTRRGENRGFTVLTAMAENGPADHDWSHLARDGEAFALYMGIGTAARTQAKLLDAGIDARTPVVIVENGTLADEKSAQGTIGTLTAVLMEASIRGPAIIYVGLEPMAGTRVDMDPTQQSKQLEAVA